jgi:hypothetical protein
MSKLSESQIRRMLQLANVKTAVADKFITESVKGGKVLKESKHMDEMYGKDHMEEAAEELEEMDVEMDAAGEGEGKVSPDVAKDVIKAVMAALGVDGEVTDEDEEGGEEKDAGEEDMDVEEPAEEEVSEAYDELEELEEGEEEELEEGEELEEARNAANEKNGEHPFLKKGGNSKKVAGLQESRFVEAIVNRVTARLIAEAKDAKKKGAKVLKGEEDKKAKMKKRVKEARNKATEKNGNHPLLSKGQNKVTGHKVKESQKMMPVKPAKKAKK